MMRNAVITGILLAALSLALVNLMAQDAGTPAPKQRSFTTQRDGDKDVAMRAKLAGLLSRVDLSVGPELPTLDDSTYKEVRIHWAATTDSAELLKPELASGGALTRVSALSKSGSLPRQRSMELSPDHLLVVALDENETVRWWKLMIDPRLARAEVGEQTAMQSENYYRPKVDFVVECPDDPLLREMRFYQPVWNGEEFRLELLGITPLY